MAILGRRFGRIPVFSAYTVSLIYLVLLRMLRILHFSTFDDFFNAIVSLNFCIHVGSVEYQILLY